MGPTLEVDEDFFDGERSEMVGSLFSSDNFDMVKEMNVDGI